MQFDEVSNKHEILIRGCLLESPHRDKSNGDPGQIISWRNIENNGHVTVMVLIPTHSYILTFGKTGLRDAKD